MRASIFTAFFLSSVVLIGVRSIPSQAADVTENLGTLINSIPPSGSDPTGEESAYVNFGDNNYPGYSYEVISGYTLLPTGSYQINQAGIGNAYINYDYSFSFSFENEVVVKFDAVSLNGGPVTSITLYDAGKEIGQTTATFSDYIKNGYMSSVILAGISLEAGTSYTLDVKGSVLSSDIFGGSSVGINAVSAVPLPASLPMFGAAVAGLVGLAKRRVKSE